MSAQPPPLSPQTISLPSGPGSIEGLGESFDPQLNTGSYVFRLPFQLPPVRGRVQPDMVILYNSGNGNGPLGLGWKLHIPSVVRQTDKGLPLYDASDRFVTGDGEELALRADGSYRRKVESDFTKWEQIGTNGWRATRRDGSVMLFGATAQSRQDRATNQTYRWMLESAEDTNGNRVEYDYLHDEGQIYPAEIRYGLHATEASAFYRIVFDYDDERLDMLSDYRGRFRCTTRLRLRTVTLMFGERRIRQWQLDYHEARPLSLLARFTQYGDERTETGPGAAMNEDYLPPIEFDYSPQQLGADISFTDYGLFAFISLANREAELIDLNRDGLPDILLYEDNKYHSMVNQGPAQPFGSLTEFTSPVYYPPLDDPNTKLADLRGDGVLTVLIDEGDDFYYREFTSATTLGPDVDFNIPGNFPFSDPQVQTVDINSTRAMDFMAPDFDRFAFIINGVGGAPNSYYESPTNNLAQSVNFSAGWQFADMTGDRLLDLVVIDTVEGGGVVFYPSMGWGEFDAPVFMLGGPSDSDIGSRGLAGFALVDLDGDGLADLVQVDSGLVRIWPNLSGSEWGAPVSITEAQVPDWNAGADGTAVRFVDINGNGSTDIVWNDPLEGIFLRSLELHPHTKPNLLTTMRNGMGRELEIEYRTSTDYMLEAKQAGDPWTAVPPFPIPVVSAFTERDGMGSTYRTEVTYRNGYYDGAEREFRGFERAIQVEVGNTNQFAPSLVTEFVFDTGAQVEALKGVVRMSELRTTDGDVFHRVTTEWDHRSIIGAPGIGEDRDSVYAFPESETTEVIEGGALPAVTLYKEFEYDEFGNEIVRADYGRVEGANWLAWEDERIIRRTFTASHADGLNTWMLALPVSELIEDGTGAVAAVSHYFYDDPAFSGANTGQVTKGNLTLLRKAVDSASQTFIAVQRMTYDVFGNPVHLLDPLGTTPGAPHSRTIAYDNELHTHPVSETVYIGGSVGSTDLTADYDIGLGVLIESSDFNHHVTHYRYDPFGRLSAIIKPGDSLVAPTEEYEFRLGMPLSGGRTINWIETRIRETAGGGTIDSRMFFDGLRRKIMRRAEGETAGQIVVSDTVVFNDRRTEWKSYLPYFETGTLDFSDPVFNTPFQERHYDALGRLTRLYQPDTGMGRPFSQTTHGPLSRLVQNEEQTRLASPHFGCGMRYVEDGLRNREGQGRLRIVEEIVKIAADGTPLAHPAIWTTTYRYDTLDNFIGYTDSLGNQKHMRYDGLSRLMFMDDPDRGPYWWAYDDAGNVLRTCDAKNQHLAYGYDGANRILAEWHIPVGEGGPAPAPGQAWLNPPPPPATPPQVSYHYDVSAGPMAREEFWRPREAEGIAQIVLERTAALPLADVNEDGVVDVRDVALRSSSPASGPSIEASNVMSRLAWVEDQSGEEHFSYDERGRAVWKVKRFHVPGETDQLSFYVENSFDSSDRLTRHVYADGMYVEYHYNPRGLLDSVAGAIDLVNYNPAGQNARIDLANGISTIFTYDNRLRLKDIVSTRPSDSTALKSLVYEYDEVSNIIGITDQRSAAHRTLMRDQAGATALSTADLNDTRSFVYDSLYRLTSAIGPAHGTHSYRFDPIGNMLQQGYAGDIRFAPPEQGTMAYGQNGYGPHVLTTVTRPDATEIAFIYDANGNLLTIGDEAELVWDPKDRLIGASEDGVQHTYIYDYGNRRSVHQAEKDGQVITRTYYVDNVSEFRDGRLVKYIYVGDEKVARSDFSGTPGEPVVADHFYLHDHLGSTSVAMGPDATVRQLSSYTPYGHNRLRGLGGTKTIDYGFSGKELHESPDLAYFETRYLSSGQARFTQPDTLTLDPPADWRLHPQKWHPYSYTWGNPVSKIDPDGRIAVPLLVKAAPVIKAVVNFAGKVSAVQAVVSLTQPQVASGPENLASETPKSVDIGKDALSHVAGGEAVKAVRKIPMVDKAIKTQSEGLFRSIRAHQTHPTATQAFDAMKATRALGNEVAETGAGSLISDTFVGRGESNTLQLEGGSNAGSAEIRFDPSRTAPHSMQNSLIFDQPFDTQSVRPFPTGFGGP